MSTDHDLCPYYNDADAIEHCCTDGTYSNYHCTSHGGFCGSTSGSSQRQLSATRGIQSDQDSSPDITVEVQAARGLKSTKASGESDHDKLLEEMMEVRQLEEQENDEKNFHLDN